MELYDTSPQLDSLLTAMKREARKARALYKVRIGIAFSWVAGLPIYFLLAHVFGWHNKLNYVNLALQTVNVSAMMLAYLINSNKRQYLVKKLASIEDKQACGAMADVLGFEDVELKKIARDALKILLPRLQSTDADLLSTTQRQHLHGILKQQDTELTLILLHTLEQVGDMRDWNAVQNLANGKLKGKAKANPEVIRAAQECLPFLQANAERQEIQHTLLRASDSQTATPDILLRPAAPIASDPAHLLRAGLNAGNPNENAE